MFGKNNDTEEAVDESLDYMENAIYDQLKQFDENPENFTNDVSAKYLDHYEEFLYQKLIHGGMLAMDAKRIAQTAAIHINMDIKVDMTDEQIKRFARLMADMMAKIQLSEHHSETQKLHALHNANASMDA